MAFKVGDRVVIVKSSLSNMVGVVTAVASELHPLPPHTSAARTLGAGRLVHDLTVPSIYPNTIVVYPPEWLEPYRSDGHERGEWDELTRRLCKPERVGA